MRPVASPTTSERSGAPCDNAGSLAVVLNLGTGELVVIFLVALIVLGPTKLPDAARQMGRMAAELRRLSGGFQEEMRAAMREPAPTLPPLPPAAVVTPAGGGDGETVTDTPAPTQEPTARRRREPLKAAGPPSAEQQLSE